MELFPREIPFVEGSQVKLLFDKFILQVIY